MGSHQQALLGPGGAGASGHIYWRVNSLSVALSLLEFTGIMVCIGGVDQNPIVLEHTASSAPDIAGTTAAIFDADPTSHATYLATTAEAGGFFFRWKFSGPVNVDGVKQGFKDTDGRHIDGFTLQYSDDDSAWTTLGSKTGLTFGTNDSFSSLYTFP